MHDWMAIESFTRIPYWKDECGHKPDEYIGSFCYRWLPTGETNLGKARRSMVDVYLLESGGVCLREGNEPSNYGSFPHVSMMVGCCQHASACRERTALEMILKVKFPGTDIGAIISRIDW